MRLGDKLVRQQKTARIQKKTRSSRNNQIGSTEFYITCGWLPFAFGSRSCGQSSTRCRQCQQGKNSPENAELTLSEQYVTLPMTSHIKSKYYPTCDFLLSDGIVKINWRTAELEVDKDGNGV
jgi:hypothetical protein